LASLLARGAIGAWRGRCRAMRRTAGWRPAGEARAGGGSRRDGRKHPAPSMPSPCIREAHGTGKGTGEGETGTPGRLAPPAPSGGPAGTRRHLDRHLDRHPTRYPAGHVHTPPLPPGAHGGAAVPGVPVRRGPGPVRRCGATECWPGRCDAVLGRPGAAGLAGCDGVRCDARWVRCGWRRDGRCGATGRGPPGRVRRAAREGDPPAWVFWLLANGREGHVPTPATNRLVAKPEKKYCGVCPMP